jgi:hypothetical protein
LIRAVEERVSDQGVLKLLRAMLRAGVMSDGQVTRSVTGAPQGGVGSPLLANVYLHRIDRAWDVREHGVLVRFADDVVVMCTTREQAEAALARLRVLLAELGLEPKSAKTRIVQLAVDGPGFDFLGFHHRLVRSDGRRSRKHVTFLARWPTDKAMQRARDRRGDEPVPAWLGRVFPVRELDDALREDDQLRTAAVVHRGGQASPAQPRMGSIGGVLPITEPPRADWSYWNRRRTQTLSGLAGKTECRR